MQCTSYNELVFKIAHGVRYAHKAALVAGISGLVALLMPGLVTATVSYVALQPEAASLSMPETRVTDTTASGGAAVRFTARSGSNFLSRQGANLRYQNADYRFVGVNAYGLATCEGYTYTTADLNALFQALPPHTITRTWATARASLADLDRVVAAAEANNQMLILSLIDGANNCNANDLQLNRSFYQSGYTADYFSWVRTIVPRYANSPAIGMWEIANEPGWGCPGGDCGVSREELRAFIDASAALIKSLDPNHLVESGSIGKELASTASQTDYAYVHAGSNVDVLSLHEYEYDYNGNTGAQYWFPTARAAASSLQKPIIIGETGAYLSQPSNTTCYNSNMTIQSLAGSKIDDYLTQGANGVFIWNWMKSKPSWVGTGCGSSQHFFYGTSNAVFTTLQGRMPAN